MTLLLSIDPGLASGVSYGFFNDSTAYENRKSLIVNFEELSKVVRSLGETDFLPDVLVIERFVPQSGLNFTPKEDDMAACEVIGMLKYALVPKVNEVYWRLRSDKTQVPDSILKKHDLWQSAKSLGWTDNRDAMDAVAHAIGHLAFTKQHEPTLREYFHA